MFRKRFLFVVAMAFSLFGFIDIARGLGWSDVTIRLLDDSCFAAIEYDENGLKYRHCPHHDANGNLDEEQLIFVLGTFSRESWVDSKTEHTAKTHLEKHYQRLKTRMMTHGPDFSVNIRDATLVELVSLPSIGPILAVRIVEYRASHAAFMRIEDIQKIDGIGSTIFKAIRHYISL